MNQAQITLRIGSDHLEVSPNPDHEWTLDTKSVAVGYGVTPDNIRMHKANRPDELLEGKHWFNVSNPYGGHPMLYWTKRGVVRLGMFIRSSRGKHFRDLAEDLILRDTPPPSSRETQNDPLLMQLELVRQIRQEQLALEDRTAALELAMESTTLNSLEVGQIYRLGQSVARAIGGKYHVVWHEFKTHFQLASYRDLPRSKFLEGVQFLRDWYEKIRTGDGLGLLEERAA